MRHLSSFVGLVLLSGVLANDPIPPTRCNANNCARAVTGTRAGKMPPVSSRQADCSSFMMATVTPATSTETSTTTVTETSFLPNKRNNLANRQVTVVPSSIPAYASDCTSAAAYSSACSCWGITAMTTTAPTPVTTITVTATVTVAGCSTGLTQCNGACKDLSNDPSNCGACNTVCTSGICTNGACTNPSCTGQTCDTFTTCGAGGSCVCGSTTDGSGFCVDGSTGCSGLADCGTSSDCPSGQVCAVGSCCGRNVCIGATFCGGSSVQKLFMRDPTEDTFAHKAVDD